MSNPRKPGRYPPRQQPLPQDEPSARRGDTPGLSSARREASRVRTADPLERHPSSQRLLRHMRTPSVKKGRHMQTLWGESASNPRRRRRKVIPLPPTPAYSITGTGNDCEILGHVVNPYDLAGCTTCIDCGVHVFCPGCTPKHPTDEHAIPVCCPRHEESVVHHAV